MEQKFTIMKRTEQIIKDLMEYKKIFRKSHFANFLGIPKSTLANWEARDSINIQKIKEAMPEISTNWLMYGEGEMLETPRTEPVEDTQIPSATNDLDIVPAEIVEEIKEEVKEELVIAESVPMLPRDVSIATDVNIRNYIEENGDELRRINPSQMLQEANPDIAERVLQPSMLPTFAPGDTIFIRFIKDKAKLIDGKIYHFDLKALPTMIRMVKIEGEKIRLIALNPNFGDMVVDRTDIVGVAEIVGLLRMTFVDFYSDLERERKQKDEQITEMISSHTAQVDNLIKQIAKFGEREDRLIDILEKRLEK